MESALDDGNDLIWGIGFMMADAVLEAAQNNPDQKYAIIDSAFEETPPNLVGVVFQAEQASFLVGYIAGKMTETGKVGFIGGIKFALIEEFEYEPSAIIEALFESKETKKSNAFKERKLKREKLPFFSNSNNYIKRNDNGHK